jgi:hypothetical protein
VAADLDIRIVGGVRKPQRVFVPANGTHRIPDADEVGFAGPGRERRFEIGGEPEVALPRRCDLRPCDRYCRSPSACELRKARALDCPLG